MHPQYSGSAAAMAGAKHLCKLLNQVLDNNKQSIDENIFKFKRKTFINYS